MKRRHFLQSGTAAISGISICPLESLASSLIGEKVKPVNLNSKQYNIKNQKLQIELKKIPFLQTSGSAAKISFKKENIKKKIKILIVHTNNGYKAFENRCTHGGMSMKFLTGENQLRCTSFGHSKFDLGGNVVKGPATNQLKKYDVVKAEGYLTIVLTN